MKHIPVLLAIIASIMALIAPLFASPIVMQLMFDALIIATLAQAWNIIGGFTGYASFGNSVFYGLGAYGAGIAMVQFNLPFFAGATIGIVAAVIFAMLIGLPILRLKGHYFAIATLALPQVMAAITANVPVAGENIGLVLPLLNNDTFFYESALVLLIIATCAVALLSRSRFGFGLIAIRENEEGAAAMGINTTLYKILALMLSGAFCALAGALQAYKVTFLDPEAAYQVQLNVQMIIMAVFGGAGTIFGPVFGALFLQWVSNWLSTAYTDVAGMFFGIVIVVAVVLMPRGLADLLRNLPRQGWRYFINNIKANKL
ncbi:branched-chain amino acid ABC transporter permease [Ochrobactrum sp. RH2CCR150]|uniref:branched-chain amino acid ABC transporter permease n=1 Tax=Ochrobactrum sp. RH2CCR150 TaxID=2587044 RepID=UPI0015FB7B29|nr:branched-chain amino acid transport system permease protein [Ochrobactrum sp. RH2CCR150]